MGRYWLDYIFVPYLTTMTFSGMNYNFKIIHINSFFIQEYGPFLEYRYVIFTIKSPLDKLHPKEQSFVTFL